MNAAQLFSGEFYAWKMNPPRGRIPLDAKKVRLRHTEQRKKSYMQNRHTVAAITEIDTGKERVVPAREIIAFWDDYESEVEVLKEERRQVEMRKRRGQLRREVIEAMINYRFNERGFPFVVQVPYSGAKDVTIRTDALLNYLDITEDHITEAINRAMEKEYGETGV